MRSPFEENGTSNINYQRSRISQEVQTMWRIWCAGCGAEDTHRYSHYAAAEEFYAFGWRYKNGRAFCYSCACGQNIPTEQLETRITEYSEKLHRALDEPLSATARDIESLGSIQQAIERRLQEENQVGRQ
jgi:hypothetical protein